VKLAAAAAGTCSFAVSLSQVMVASAELWQASRRAWTGSLLEIVPRQRLERFGDERGRQRIETDPETSTPAPIWTSAISGRFREAISIEV